MRTLDYNKIEYCKNNKFNFDIGKYFNQSIELFKNNWQQFVLYSFVSVLILFVSYFTIIGSLIIMYPLLMGYLVAAERADDGLSLEFNDFFKGFKNIGTYALLALSIIVLYGILVTPFFLMSLLPLMVDEANDTNTLLILGSSIFVFIFMFVLIILLFVFQILIFLTPYLIHYGDMSLRDAIKTSYAIVKKNFWWMLLLLFISGFISSCGAFACYVGALVSFPVGYIFIYFMLKDMILTGDEIESEIDLLGTNQE
ncbi:hypothetical protein [Chishuiella changwenlii]|jgi:uncharacterized membrane protein|uniref:hypothetical protein n=1 Tax=Chishuiella changwenlii TaxID=1434701 RepID=UPI002FDA5B90